MSWFFYLCIVFLFFMVGLIGIVFRKLITSTSLSSQSFEETDTKDFNESENATPFSDHCILLSKECRGNDLWIIFIDENAMMQEEMQVKDSDVCSGRYITRS